MVEIEEKREFGDREEEATISLIFDLPEFFISVANNLKLEFFKNRKARYVYTIIDYFYDRYGTVITRELCRDEALKQLTADDDYEEILALIGRESDQREAPIIRDRLIEWARNQTFRLLYSAEALSAVEAEDYTKIEEIFDEASKIKDISVSGYWFFERINDLFMQNKEKKLTCGFSRLDECLNEGGPTKKETFCWMAPTGVGKSLMMINTAVANIKKGEKVLHITMEMSELKTALRYAGSFTEIEIAQRMSQEQKMRTRLEKMEKTYGGGLVIYEFPPYTISSSTISSLVDSIRRIKSFNPTVIILDYLELMAQADKDEYISQRKIATELRGVASKEDVFVVTGTQTNRSSMEGSNKEKNSTGSKEIDLDKTADSFGKMMPFDYVVSINQTRQEYDFGSENKAKCRLYIAKNRNGPKFKTINATIDYGIMKAREEI